MDVIAALSRIGAHCLLAALLLTAHSLTPATALEPGESLLRGALSKPAPADGKIHPIIVNAVSRMHLIHASRQTSDRAGDASVASNPLVRIDPAGMIQTYIHLTGSVGMEALAELKGFGVRIDRFDGQQKILQGWIPYDRVADVSQRPYVRLLTAPDYGFPRAGSARTEGDEVLGAGALRALGFDGTGVRVGVVSDGVDNLELSQGTEDLPGVRVVTSAGSGDEGTALLEIVHDLAPGATLGFCGLPTLTTLELTGCIADLTDSFQADIIVDDIGAFGEPYFEDGSVARSVARAVAEGVVFASSAGNAALKHYEAEFMRTAAGAFQLHDFGAAAGGMSDTSMDVVVAPGATLVAFLQWNDPFAGSANDYDLGLADEAGNIVAASVGWQDGNDDPLEIVFFHNPDAAPVRVKVLVERFQGEDRRLEINFLGDVTLAEYRVSAGSIFGHPAVPGVLAVGAIDALDPGNDDIERFSSQGPAEIFFPTRQTRNKPDLAAVDGVSISGAGGLPSPFFGTSASAPHVAGIAALLKGAFPNARAAQIRTALAISAVDLGTPGFDPIFGAGRVDALAAAAELAVPDIKANGLDGPLTLSGRDTLSITIAMDSGNRSLIGADWWLIAATPLGYFSLSARVGGWTAGIEPAIQGPVVAFGPVEALRATGLPTGAYEFYLALDKRADGLLNGPIFFDKVSVNLVP